MTTVSSPPRPRRIPRIVKLAFVAAVAVLTLAACSPDVMHEMDLTNTTRAQNGRAYLANDNSLYFKAQGWADQLSRDGYLHHSNLTDGAPGGWWKLGENVGVGYSVDSVHQAFLNSSGHRANILDPSFNNFGVGVTFGGDGRVWVVQEFAQL